MNSIQMAYENALLADATYALGDGVPNGERKWGQSKFIEQLIHS